MTLPSTQSKITGVKTGPVRRTKLKCEITLKLSFIISKDIPDYGRHA